MPPKGTFWAKTDPFGAQKRPDTRPKCVVIMSLTKRWQLGPNLAPPGPLRTSRSVVRTSFVGMSRGWFDVSASWAYLRDIWGKLDAYLGDV